MKCQIQLHCLLLILLSWAVPGRAEVPVLLNHQGRIAVDGLDFSGDGLFKFALVGAGGSTTFWSHDGTSDGGSEPASSVSLTVVDGNYAVLLGDTTVTNMSALSAAIFDNADVRLRVWFDDGVHGSEWIQPDYRLAPAPYALVASRVEQVLLSEVVAPPAQPVIAWGKNTQGQSTVPVITNVIAVSGGNTQSLALLRDGTVVAWGSGPAVPAGLENVVQIASGVNHHLARKSDGTLAAWGGNGFGQTALPAGLASVIDVAAGEKHSLALLADGTVTAWGDDFFGQSSPPAGLNSVTAIAAGYDHSLALRADGTVTAWGRSDAGQVDVPAGLTNVAAVAAGAYHSLAVLHDGTVVAWGWDAAGQSTVPPDLAEVTKVAGGYGFSIALKADGTVVAWGENANGQLAIPVTATQVVQVTAGAEHALALRAELVPARVARLDQDNVFQGRVGIKRSASTNSLEVEGNASKTVAGNWLANSDRRIKHDVRPLEGALEKLERVSLVDFRYTEDYRASHPGIDDKRYLNVIAQDFASVFPDHVQSSGESLPDGSPILQVDTYPLVIYSAAAVKELHRENTALKERLASQEERLRRLEALVKDQP